MITEKLWDTLVYVTFHFSYQILVPYHNTVSLILSQWKGKKSERNTYLWVIVKNFSRSYVLYVDTPSHPAVIKASKPNGENRMEIVKYVVFLPISAITTFLVFTFQFLGTAPFTLGLHTHKSVIIKKPQTKLHTRRILNIIILHLATTTPLPSTKNVAFRNGANM